MTGKLNSAALTLIAFLPNLGYSLGLGNISVNSGLNQPLRAEIEIFSEDAKEVTTLNVRLAGSAEFQRAGLERPFLLSRLRFEVINRPNGRSVIAVRSSDPIREPLVNFLVEVNWAAGHLLREYAILLDPPRFTPRTGISYPLEKPRPIMPRPEPPLEREAARQDQYGPVRRDENLWKIAGLVRPDPSLSDKQVMMALFNANPGDFRNNNMHYLKRGSILRIPSAAQMHALSHEEALVEFQRHQKAWWERRAALQQKIQQQTPTQIKVSPEQLQAQAQQLQPSTQPKTPPTPAPTSPATTLGSVSAPEVRLLSPDPNANTPALATTNPATPSDGAAVADLRQKIDLAQEISHTNSKENEELRARLAALEEKIAGLQHEIRIKDENLAAIQNQNRASPPPQPVEQPRPQLPPPKPPILDAPIAKPKPPVTPVIPKTTPGIKKPAPEPEPESFGGLLSDPMFLTLVGALLASIALLAGLLIRRRRATALPLEDLDEEPENIVEIDAELADALDGAPPTPHPQPQVNTPNQTAGFAPLPKKESPAAPTPILEKKDPSLPPPPTLVANVGTMAMPTASNIPAPKFAATALFDKPLALENPPPPPPPKPNNVVLPPAAPTLNVNDDFEMDLGFLDDEEDDIPPVVQNPSKPPPPSISTKSVGSPLSISSPRLSKPLGTKVSIAPPYSQINSVPIVEPKITNPTDDLLDEKNFLADLDLTSITSSAENKNLPNKDIKEPIDTKKLAESMDFDLVDISPPPQKKDAAPLSLDQSIMFDLSADDGISPHENDEVDTKLDLAKAYVDMKDYEGAHEILQEIIAEGNSSQKLKAKEYLAQIPK